MRHMGKTDRRGRKKNRRSLQEIDAEYNRIIAAREEYERAIPEPEKPRVLTPSPGTMPSLSRGVPVRSKGEVYRRYIASDRWKERRAEYFQSHKRRCSACGSTVQIHLHHRTYDRMGAELDSDLTPLCQGCHTKVHQLHNAGKLTLAKATDRVVEERGRK